MRSMTGYGRGTCELAGRRFVVELRSLNHRFLEVKLRLPWADASIDMHVTQALRARLDRGVVTVSVRDEKGGAPQTVRVDVDLARGYERALEQLRTTLSLAEPISLALIAAQPGVITVGEGVPEGDLLWAALEPGINQAIDALIESREREGAAIAVDLRARVATLEKLVGDLRELTRDAPETFRKRLLERLERTGAAGEVDPHRLAQEVAIMADRLDVSEELTRLGAHLTEFKRLVEGKQAAGRRLDFLAQELNREINTIGSKSQSGPSGARVIDAKAELERVREQIQNVE
jgi:uncharacterized protein (TIGR00255 family)